MSLYKLVATDHLNDVGLVGSAKVGRLSEGDALEKGQIAYSVTIAVQLGHGLVEVELSSEETPITFPFEVLTSVVPEVFQQLTEAASKMMLEALKGATDDAEE